MVVRLLLRMFEKFRIIHDLIHKSSWIITRWPHNEMAARKLAEWNLRAYLWAVLGFNRDARYDFHAILLNEQH